MSKKIILVDRLHPSIVPMLENIGVTIHYEPKIELNKLHAILPEFDGLIDRSYLDIDKFLLEKATNLKFIARAGAGLDKIDLDEIKRRNITLLNAPEGNRDALAEHAMALLLSVLNNIKKSDQEVRNWIWEREGNRGHELGNKTVGLIGYGHMAQAFAKRLTAFGCNVLAYDPLKTNFSDQYAAEATLEQIFNETDIVSIHTPLTPHTEYLIDIHFLRNFKKPIWLLNTARGKNLKIADLITALDEKIVLGAGLDVLENEKISSLDNNMKTIYQKLFEYNNVIITPHIGGWSFESHVRINEVLVNKIKDYLHKFDNHK